MPFYHITNILEGREKTIHLKLQPYISRINKIKNAHTKHKHLLKLYKSYNYSPIMSLRSLSSLAIQVPFFIVAYQTLSKILIDNPYNSDMSFLFIKNLGLQDNLIGGVNLLPILMTLINILAVMCMTSFPKERRKSYAIAVFFLIFLYMSPAGLVLYWTSNNLINLFRYLFIYLKDKRLPAIKHILISYLSRLLKNADLRAFLLLITVYFTANAKANNLEYSNIIAIPWYILFILKLYSYKIKPYMTKNIKIQLSLVVLCLVVSCFVKRWEKTHWLFAALTLFAMYNYKSIKLVKIKKILKYLALPVVGMLFPAVLYVKANAIYINGCGYISYFSIFILIACFIPLVVYVYNTNYSISKIIKISLSFILAAMLPPLIRSVIKYTGSYPCDFIFLLFILYFIVDLFWKKKKVIIIFLLSATLFSVFYKINLNPDKDADEVAAQVPEELLAIPMKDTPTVYLFMYDSFPHKELINELGLDRSGLDALLREYQFKEYDVYSLAYHTIASMAQVFSVRRDDIMDGNVCRKIIVGNNLVNAVFKRHGYNNFVSADDDHWAFPNITYFKNYNIISNMNKNKSSIDFAFSLRVICSIIKGSLNTGVLSLEEGNNCFKLAKFANRGEHERTFAWGMSDYPGHSSVSGKGFEREFKRWESRYYMSIENMKRDMKLAISNNPSAIVILMSDHGPVLLDDASRGYPSLKDDQIKPIHFRDMFGAFMAVRWPDKERAAKYDKEFNITQDVFPIVFAYLCDSPIPLKYKIKDTAIRMRDHRNHKFDKGVFYPNFYEEEK